MAGRTVFRTYRDARLLLPGRTISGADAIRKDADARGRMPTGSDLPSVSTARGQRTAPAMVRSLRPAAQFSPDFTNVAGAPLGNIATSGCRCRRFQSDQSSRAIAAGPISRAANRNCRGPSGPPAKTADRTARSDGSGFNRCQIRSRAAL